MVCSNLLQDFGTKQVDQNPRDISMIWPRTAPEEIFGKLWETLENLGKPRKTKVSQSFPKFPKVSQSFPNIPTFDQSQGVLPVGCATQEPSARCGAKSDSPASELPLCCVWQITQFLLCWHNAGFLIPLTLHAFTWGFLCSQAAPTKVPQDRCGSQTRTCKTTPPRQT